MGKILKETTVFAQVTDVCIRLMSGAGVVDIPCGSPKNASRAMKTLQEIKQSGSLPILECTERKTQKKTTIANSTRWSRSRYPRSYC